MTDLLIYNAHIITPQTILERGWLICRDGRISAIGNGIPARKPDKTAINADGLTLLPGMIDIHTHGAMGHDMMNASRDDFIQLSQFYARHGVTSFLATTHPDTTDRITNTLITVKNTLKHPDLGANLLGVHLEGPYLNKDYVAEGYQTHVRPANPIEGRDWLTRGVIKLITLAPEIPANEWFIREAVAQGITVSVGYSDATYTQTRHALSLGLTHSTHTFNDMRPFHHHEVGVVGAVLEANHVTCELIADGVHVSDGAMRLLWMLKRPDKLVLVSASSALTGLGDGEFMLDGRPVHVMNGVARSDSGDLAGSIITLDESLRRFMTCVDEPIDAVWQTVSLNPARAIHVAHRKGSVEIGKDADLILVDGDMQVQKTLVMGRGVAR
ncbi:MAG: N-acetylglucosamine-6-phosphate deacetylase [Anaerolineae bacterium]|nr:N-acetylglucosamine-6-phosphate deacetylase [Anaerolineae bacterium]